jgi:protein phosphatase
MRFLHASAQHIGARRSQEDSFGFSGADDPSFLAHAGFLAVLCDGMGGMEHGGEASSNAVTAFLKAYGTKQADESIPAALQRSVRDTNAQVVELARKLGATEGIGTTLIATVLHKGLLYYISVGDSGLFHLSRGILRLINHPHVFAAFLDKAVERGVMTEQAALEHPERDALTSFIGADPLEEVDSSADPLRLSSGDTILLASDGLFNTLSAMEIRKAMEGDPRKWPELLVARALDKQNEFQDNVTVLTLTLLSQ